MLAATILLIAGLAVPAPAAWAAVTSSVDAGALTITSDNDGDLINVRCSAADGDVQVNGADPDSGAVACAEITSMVLAAGGGDDVVYLTVEWFDALTSANVDLGDGNDVFQRVGRVPCSILGGPGDDRIWANPIQGDVVDGGDDVDTLVGHITVDVTITDTGFMFEGATVPFVSIEALQLYGNPGPQAFDAHGSSGSVQAQGRGGDDRLIGGTGKDSLDGMTGDDVLIGGPEHDFITGGPGDDVVRGKAGTDELYGDKGNDVLHGGPGPDVLEGGTGQDTCSGDEGPDRYYGCE
jgi:Ca2+-binding RTX toxin-like protein